MQYMLSLQQPFSLFRKIVLNGRELSLIRKVIIIGLMIKQAGTFMNTDVTP